jgi:hypothetical protein
MEEKMVSAGWVLGGGQGKVNGRRDREVGDDPTEADAPDSLFTCPYKGHVLTGERLPQVGC